MFEGKHEPLLPRRLFALRMVRTILATGAVVMGCLSLGILGYHFIVGLDWLDALLNASMILTGMGPVDRVTTPGGKLFASAYALFAGVAFLTMVALLIAPVAHRLLHRFHLEDDTKA